MSNLFGVGLNIECNRINAAIKMQLQKKGGIGLRALAIMLYQADLTGSGQLSPQDFEKVLNSFGLFFSKVEIQILVRSFGNPVDYKHFLKELRGTLSDRRYRIVKLAFENADINKNGKLSIEEIEARYDV